MKKKNKKGKDKKHKRKLARREGILDKFDNVKTRSIGTPEMSAYEGIEPSKAKPLWKGLGLDN